MAFKGKGSWKGSWQRSPHVPFEGRKNVPAANKPPLPSQPPPHRGGATPPADERVPVYWVTVEDGTSTLLEEANVQESRAPSISHQKGKAVFSSATWLLGDVVGDIKVDVVFHHDSEMVNFPEIGEALKAVVPKDAMNGFCVAVSNSTGKWGIGMGSGWKTRESAAKVALALAIVKDSPESLAKLCTACPEFKAVCQSAGLVLGGGVFGRGNKRGGNAVPPTFTPVVAKTKVEQRNQPEPGLAVSWITVSGDSKFDQEGLPDTAPVLVHVKGASAFSEGHSVLQELLDDVKNLVTFEDDGERIRFPDVAEAIQEAGLESNCYCVAICPSKSKWAVGMAGNIKARLLTSKLALALAIAQDDADEVSRLGVRYPGFAALCGSGPVVKGTTIKRGGAGHETQPAPKRQRSELATPIPRAASTQQQAVPSAKPVFRPQRGEAAIATPKAASASQTKVPFGGQGQTRRPSKKPLVTDSPMWIEIPVEKGLPKIISDMSPGAVVVGTEGKKRRDLYACLNKVLARLIGEQKTNVLYYDDPDLKMFRQVGQALKQHGDEEAPQMLAVCRSASAWGVGLGYTLPHRQEAARAALAASVVLKMRDEGEFPDLSDFPVFEEFIGQISVA